MLQMKDNFHQMFTGLIDPLENLCLRVLLSKQLNFGCVYQKIGDDLVLVLEHSLGRDNLVLLGCFKPRSKGGPEEGVDS